MATRRDMLRRVGGVCACTVGLAGCSGEGSVDGVELSNVMVETLTIGVRATAHYANGTGEVVTAETTVELTVGEGDDAATYEGTERTELAANQNSSVQVVFSDEDLMGGIDDRIDATVRTAFPESDLEPPTPGSCEDCTA